jgi:4-hydroxybenzoate polyprenyltransferase
MKIAKSGYGYYIISDPSTKEVLEARERDSEHAIRFTKRTLFVFCLMYLISFTIGSYGGMSVYVITFIFLMSVIILMFAWWNEYRHLKKIRTELVMEA